MLAAVQPLQLLLFKLGENKLKLSSRGDATPRIPGRSIARLSRKGAIRAGEQEQNARQSAANTSNTHLKKKKKPFENEAGRILVYIWNIPEKMNKHEFTFLMSRIPGVECWEYIQKGYHKSAGYAYCECPVMEDAEETISLLRRFAAHGQKLRAALYNPDKIGIAYRDSTAAPAAAPAADRSSWRSGKVRKAFWSSSSHFDSTDDNGSRGHWRGSGFRRPKKQEVKQKVVIPKRPPSSRLTLGYSPRYSPQHWDRVRWRRAAAGSDEGRNENSKDSSSSSSSSSSSCD